VLVNAVTPGRLSQNVLADEKYKRCFGERNFEVVRESSATLRTRHLIDERYYYDFTVSATGTVVIEERDAQSEEVLELVDVALPGLPKSLTDMYSHWRSSKSGSLVLRPIPFNKRTALFIVTPRTAGVGGPQSNY